MIDYILHASEFFIRGPLGSKHPVVVPIEAVEIVYIVQGGHMLAKPKEVERRAGNEINRCFQCPEETVYV